MQRSYCLHWIFATALAVGLMLCCQAVAKPVQDGAGAASISPLAAMPLALTPQDRDLLETLHLDHLPVSQAGISRLRLEGTKPVEPEHDARGNTRERLDFGRIGGVALVSREVDQYGRVRGVNFLTYEDAASRWNMKLNVKHGAMLQITRRWGGGKRPLSYGEVTSLAAENR